MERIYKTITGLTYTDLDAALRHLGYVHEATSAEIIYHYPDEPSARLIYPVFPADAEVRGIDLLATQKILDGFGIMSAEDFDLLLIRLASPSVPTR